MKDLIEIRKEINEIDQEMIRLFEKRMSLAKDVLDYKTQHHLPIYDKTREDEILKRNADYLKDKSLLPFYLAFQQELMNHSKRYQESLQKKK